MTTGEFLRRLTAVMLFGGMLALFVFVFSGRTTPAAPSRGTPPTVTAPAQAHPVFRWRLPLPADLSRPEKPTLIGQLPGAKLREAPAEFAEIADAKREQLEAYAKFVRDLGLTEEQDQALRRLIADAQANYEEVFFSVFPPHGDIRQAYKTEDGKIIEEGPPRPPADLKALEEARDRLGEELIARATMIPAERQDYLRSIVNGIWIPFGVRLFR